MATDGAPSTDRSTTGAPVGHHPEPARRHPGWQDLTGLVVGAASRTSTSSSVLLVVAGLLGSWALGLALGGAHVSPHWFYLPILYAALRFGPPGALLTALGATVLAGPLLPEDVAAGIAQDPAQWAVRGAAFVVLGQIMAIVLLGHVEPFRRENEALRRSRELHDAIEDGQLVLHYQPFVHLGNGQVVGVEALVRWQHPTDGLRMPDTFLPEAERAGDVVAVDRWVLRHALGQAARWDLATGPPTTIAVNLSGISLDEPDLATRVERELAAAGLPPARLCLEVTETALMADPERSSRVVRSLRSVGVHVAIDDFGSGFASYGQLPGLPADVIKIDRSLVQDVAHRARARHVAAGLVDLARALDAATVAEGVETAEQAQVMAELGCTYAQGYLYARPLEADAAGTALEHRGGIRTSA